MADARAALGGDDIHWSVRCLPRRRGEADLYQAIARHVPTGVAGWAMGFNRAQASVRAAQSLNRLLGSDRADRGTGTVPKG